MPSDQTPLTEEDRRVIQPVIYRLARRRYFPLECALAQGIEEGAAVMRASYSTRERAHEESRQALRTTLAAALGRERALTEAANGVLDHYFHRRAKSLLQDPTLEAAWQRLARVVSSDPAPSTTEGEKPPADHEQSIATAHAVALLLNVLREIADATQGPGGSRKKGAVLDRVREMARVAIQRYESAPTTEGVGGDDREWILRWDHRQKRHYVDGPSNGFQMEGLTVVPKAARAPEQPFGVKVMDGEG